MNELEQLLALDHSLGQRIILGDMPMLKFDQPRLEQMSLLCLNFSQIMAIALLPLTTSLFPADVTSTMKLSVSRPNFIDAKERMDKWGHVSSLRWLVTLMLTVLWVTTNGVMGLAVLSLVSFYIFIKNVSFQSNVFLDGDSDTGTTCKWQTSGGLALEQVRYEVQYDPKTDGPPTLNSKGWYLHAGAVTIFPDNPSVLTSPALPAMAATCKLTLAAWNYGPKSGEIMELTFKLKKAGSPDGSELTVGQSSVKMSSGWQTIQPIQFLSTYDAGSVLYIDVAPQDSERNRNDNIYAVDNIQFIDCSVTRSLPDLACDFNDHTTCKWNQDPGPLSPQMRKL